ncbi:MAG: bifunctional diaminohydroxyphosphoribosylaminopyrimidine deaminase/5-amino-6-(5-phosphoribosylamino)uracil reductase RibD, partial [Phycisphaerae bacterium]
MDPRSRDERFMRRALDLAPGGLGRVAPNPMVGAVVVQGDRVVGEGFHARFGGPHAEVVALAQAGTEARGAELFVTLEPCCHRGKTPPCTDAILAAGVRRVVAAVGDPFPEARGRGFAILKQAGLEVEVGVLETEARRLNAAYFKRQATGLPLVIAKWAMTLDGRLATASGESRWISSEAARRRVHELRRIVDAVLVGARTARIDEPRLTVRHVEPLAERGQPARVILDAA